MNDVPSLPSRRLRAFATAARWSAGLVLAAIVLFALAWGALHGVIVPRIAEFRPRMENAASQVLGVPVRIGAVSAQSVGLIPSFELRDVALLDPQGREALRLPRVTAALSPRSLWNLGFEQLHIERPELDVRRTRDGKVYVGGLDFSGNAETDGRAADWFFSQTEFVIQGGTLRWTDELRGAAPLALADVNFVARNGLRRHDLRIDATPPADWGARFSLMAQFRQPLLSRRNGQWQDWDGELYGDFARVDVLRLRQYAELGIEVSRGRGAVRVWADVSRGQLVSGQADVALADVSATLGPNLQPLSLDAVSGRLGGRALAGGFEFSTTALQFTTADGLRWPGGNVFVSYTGGEGRVQGQGELRADRLDLAALAQIGNRLPIGTATHAALTAYAPQGLVEKVQMRWTGHSGALSTFEAKGRVTQLVLSAQPAIATTATSAIAPPHAVPGIPGVRGATVDFDLTQAGGKAKLALDNGALDVPGVFQDRVVPFGRLSADLQWQREGDRINAQLSNLRFANADTEGEAQAKWRTSDPATSTSRSRFPGVLELTGTLSRANGAQVHRYLPLSLPPTVRAYVRDAVQKGSVTGVKFAVRGDVYDMPFADPKRGEFRVSAQLQDIDFAYVPRSLGPTDTTLSWPALTGLSGELVFDRTAMHLTGVTARLGAASSVQVSKAEAHIANFAQSTTVVVTADARGPLTEMLATVGSSPLDWLTGQALGKATGTGNADLRLRLSLPLFAIDKSRVQGSVTLAGNDVQFSPATPLLAAARGVVTFSESGFAVAGAQARLLGGEVRLEGGSRKPGSGPGTEAEAATVLRARGTATAEGLRQARDLGFVSRLAQYASGSAAYAAVLAFRGGYPEITVTSTLEGMALSLPAPLGKAAETALALKVENTLVGQPSSAAPVGRAQQDQLRVDVGRVLSIAYVRDVSGPEPRVLRGGIGVGLPAGQTTYVPDEGVLAQIDLPVVDLDAWEKVLSRAAGTSVATAAVTPSPSLPSSPPAADAAARAPDATAGYSYLPTMLSVRARELLVDGRKLNNVVVGGSREGLTWRANLDATELNGYVEYRQPSGAGAGRVYARLARLNITPSAASDVEALLDEQPGNIPALDIVVEDFELRGKKLGRVEIDAINRGAAAVAREGGVREWRLNKLNVTLPEAVFTAQGNWAAVNAQTLPTGAPRTPRSPTERRRTVMNFKLDIADSGALLTRFGMKDVVRRGKGVMAGQVGWSGSPLSFDYPSMTGQFNVAIEGGQFLKADPGIAKLLGVLSLQSLPRRLSLDFRDVFTEGFAFDFVRGDVRIEQGVAITNNLQMTGVNAAVLMDGRADIARETQDLRVVVVPEINAGTASLVAAAINPAIGLGTFLAQMFLRRPLMEAATQEFHIDGTWVDPKITRVDRRNRSGALSPGSAGEQPGGVRQ